MLIKTLLIFALMVPLAYLAVKAFRWGTRFKNFRELPDSPSKARLAIAFFGGFALFLAWLISLGLTTGHILCALPQCSVVTLIDAPRTFWISAIVWYVGGGLMLGIVVHWVKYLRNQVRA